MFPSNVRLDSTVASSESLYVATPFAVEPSQPILFEIFDVFVEMLLVFVEMLLAFVATSPDRSRISAALISPVDLIVPDTYIRSS